MSITNPQPLAREVLRSIGIEVMTDRTVILTDLDDAGPRLFTHLITPTQLEYACDQHRLVTGESVDPDELENRLPWLEMEDL